MIVSYGLERRFPMCKTVFKFCSVWILCGPLALWFLIASLLQSWGPHKAEAAGQQIFLNRVLRIESTYDPREIWARTARPYKDILIDVDTVVPEGKLLIITDLSGAWRHDPPGHSWDCSIHIFDTTGEPIEAPPMVIVGTPTQRLIQVHFRAGIRVEAGQKIKIGGWGNGASDSTHYVDVTVSGFWVDL